MPRSTHPDRRVSRWQLGQWSTDPGPCQAALRILLQKDAMFEAAISRGPLIESASDLLCFLLSKCRDVAPYLAVFEATPASTWRDVVLAHTPHKGNLLGMALSCGSRFPVAMFLLDNGHAEEQLVGARNSQRNIVCSVLSACLRPLPRHSVQSPSCTYKEAVADLLSQLHLRGLAQSFCGTYGEPKAQAALTAALSISADMWHAVRLLFPHTRLCDAGFAFLKTAAQHYTCTGNSEVLELLLAEMENRTDLSFAPLANAAQGPLTYGGPFFPKSEEWIVPLRMAHHAALYRRILALFSTADVTRFIATLYVTSTLFSPMPVFYYHFPPFVLEILGDGILTANVTDITPDSPSLLWHRMAASRLSFPCFEAVSKYKETFTPSELALFSGSLFYWRRDPSRVAKLLALVNALSEAERGEYYALCTADHLTQLLWEHCHTELEFPIDYPAFSSAADDDEYDEYMFTCFSDTYDLCCSLQAAGLACTQKLAALARSKAKGALVDHLQDQRSKKSAHSTFLSPN